MNWLVPLQRSANGLWFWTSELTRGTKEQSPFVRSRQSRIRGRRSILIRCCLAEGGKGRTYHSDLEGVVTSDGSYTVSHTPCAVDKGGTEVPGSEARGLVAPSIFRPVLTASRPSQTIPTTGPESTSDRQLDSKMI